MRIVAVADTHLFHGDLVVPDGDVFVHAGDLCRFGSIDELGEAAEWIAGLPHRHKVVIAGNHDWAFVHEPALARTAFATATYLQDRAVEIEGLRFYGSPWQPTFNDWAFNLPRGPALTAVWSNIPDGIDVLITHGPPEGMGDRVPFRGPQGCADLRQRIAVARPRLHLFGHIHEDGGFWRDGVTAFANVTAWDGARGPTVIDIDGSGVTPVVIPPHGRDD